MKENTEFKYNLWWYMLGLCIVTYALLNMCLFIVTHSLLTTDVSLLFRTVLIINVTYQCFNNLREKFSPGPGFKPGSPTLRTGAIATKLPKQSSGQS